MVSFIYEAEKETFGREKMKELDVKTQIRKSQCI